MQKQLLSWQSLFFLLLFSLISLPDVQAQTISVNTFDKEHIYFGGENRRSVRNTFEFPHENVQIAQATMNFTIGCPDGGCDDWDRYGDIDVLIPTGMMDSTVATIDTTFDMSGNILQIDSTWNEPFEVLEHFEIFRFITPYGGSFSPSWEWSFTSDMSDYISLLRNDVMLQIYIDTWVNPGWEISISFDFEEGQAQREAYKVVNLWNRGSVAYGQIGWDVEENFLTPITVNADPEMHGAKVRIFNTGHGFGYTDNAAEFSPKTHHIEVDGMSSQTFSQFLWRADCADNPVSPQAGTWQYNRAGWCPGDKADPSDYDISFLAAPNEPLTIDYNLQPYTNLCNNQNPDCTAADCAGGSCDEGGNPYYIISSQLIYYKDTPQFAVDAQAFELENTTGLLCDNVVEPKLRIRNNGEETLTSMLVLYRVDGGSFQNYFWNGNLAFAEWETIALPMLNIYDNDQHSYEILLSAPNGVTDGDASNDILSTSFTFANNLITLNLNTDDYGEETSFEIRDEFDPTMTFHSGTGFASFSNITQDLCLPNGCYKLIIRDSYGDGMVGATTSGYYSLTDAEGNILTEMQDPDFGTFEQSIFCVESDLPTGVEDNITTVQNIKSYPNPTQDMLNLKVNLAKKEDLHIVMFDFSGRTIYEKKAVAVQQNIFKFDLSQQAAGVYLMQIYGETEMLYNEKVILTK
ncbi:MAG: peptide-N-glycosidase F-related protein [Chitinophagales bacterium]